MSAELWRRVAGGALLGILLSGPLAVLAAEADASAMIEALKPAQRGATRNLVVRLRPGGAAASGGIADEAAPPARATLTEEPPSLSLAVQFELTSAQVTPESGPLLGSLVAAMRAPELEGCRFLIEGHTDARGSAAQNQRLSQQRAEQVRQYLVALGVEPTRLRALGLGSQAPANPLDPLAAENRRVRVVTVP